MKKITHIGLKSLTVLGMTFGANAAVALDCGSTYTVQPGDTLSALAQKAYGTTEEFRLLYLANSETIGSNPGLISVGAKLDIPCLDVAPDASTADASVVAATQTDGIIPAPDDAQIRIVAGSNYAPFHDKSQEQGGMITEITNLAMQSANGAPNYKIDIISDWSSHLQPLISDHAYDFSLSWFRPNCDVIERLGEDSQFRCNNLAWSDPLYEQVFSYYTRAKEAPTTSHDDFFGRTVCRPEGYAIFMLEENFLTEPNITLIRAASPEECFERLNDGGVDAVAIASDAGEQAIAALGLGNAIQDNSQISQVVAFHAVISATHPQRDEYLETFNDGLAQIKQSGEWFSIVRRHLAAAS